MNKDLTHAVILHYKDGSTKVEYFLGESDAEMYWRSNAYPPKPNVTHGLVAKLTASVTAEGEFYRWNNFHYQNK